MSCKIIQVPHALPMRSIKMFESAVAQCRTISPRTTPPPPSKICIRGHNPPHEFSNMDIIPPPWFLQHGHNPPYEFYNMDITSQTNSPPPPPPPPPPHLRPYKHNLYSIKASKIISYNSLKKLLGALLECQMVRTQFRVKVCGSWSGSKLFAKVIRCQKSPLSKIHLEYFIKIVVHC